MNQAVAQGNDEAPGYLRIGFANVIWNVGGSFANQFKVANRGVIVEVTRGKPGLIQSIGIRVDLFGSW